MKESVTCRSDAGENHSSELFSSSAALSDSEDITFPHSGFVTTQSNHLVNILLSKLK